jgi:hypothetical protein
MAINNYFKSTLKGNEEQSLISDLMQECIQIQGYDIKYMPRETVNLDYLYGEDAQSKFTDAIELECYIKSFDGYGGAGETLAKFGLDIQDDLVIQIHINRFDETITQKFKEIIRPREGDLIYFGLDKHSIFEITFVNNKVPFFQAGGLYLYEINLKRFVFGSEQIDTGQFEIDDINNYGATIDIELGTQVSTSANYELGEVIYQSLDGTSSEPLATGIVLNQSNGILTIHQSTGEFVSAYNIIGEDSGTEYTFPVKSDETFDDTSANKVANNIKVREESNDVIDFSESNPFLDTTYD